MAIDSPINPKFESVSDEDAKTMMENANGRRDWTEVREALMAGNKLFLPDTQMTKQTGKYLALSLQRANEPRRLHVRKAEHDGVTGRLLWLGEDRSEPVKRS
jgi:hypothetical protein